MSEHIWVRCIKYSNSDVSTTTIVDYDCRLVVSHFFCNKHLEHTLLLFFSFSSQELPHPKELKTLQIAFHLLSGISVRPVPQPFPCCCIYQFWLRLHPVFLLGFMRYTRYFGKLLDLD